MHVNDLDGGATLTVKRERACETLGYGTVEISIRQHNSRVLGVKAKNGFESMRFGMKLLQIIRTFVRTDECKNIQLPGFHHCSDGLATSSVNNVDHARRKAIAECFEQWPYEQNAVFGWLIDDRIAHDQGRY